jgi:cytochrome c biogenesis protein CcdA
MSETARVEPASGRAVAALVFGVLGLTVAPCVGPILAIVLGSGEPSGIAKAGVILGWIALALYAMFAFLVLLLILLGVPLAMAGGGAG